VDLKQQLFQKFGLDHCRFSCSFILVLFVVAHRKVLKLFRDYVFHQADADGSSVLDLGHVISSLNKLDAGDPEKIVLASRDGESLLVVSYADISRCLEEAYEELSSADATVRGSGFSGCEEVAQPSSRFHGADSGVPFSRKNPTRFSPRSSKQEHVPRSILPPPYQSSGLQQQNPYPSQHQW